MACGSRKKVENLAPNAKQVVVEEVQQTTNYTYVRVLDDSTYWLAIERAEIKVGETYFWSRGGLMVNFWSKELKRKFPTIWFVDDFTDKPITSGNQGAPAGMMGGKGAGGRGPQPAIEKAGLVIPRAEGGITIGELYAKRDSYAGKQVKIRGEVVRYAAEIMNKNWVHIQDGTKDGNYFDLTVTTLDSMKVGDVVVFQGVITLNKDFGSGYSYEVIMEDAKRVK